MTPPITYWRVPAHADMAWRCWDDEFVFHHLLSNDTHHLAGPAGEVMRCLLERVEMETAALCECSGVRREDIGSILQTLADIDFVTWR